MKNPTDLGQLKSGEWDLLQDCADRFEKAWQASPPADLGQYLPPQGDALRRMTLLELIKTDLEFRWRRGQAVTLEYYTEHYPELGPTRDLPIPLIYEEYRVRHAHGDKPALELYQGRFPTPFAELRRLVEERTEVGPGRLASAPTPGPATLPDIAIESTSQLPLGGGYNLIARIGSGGFGEVWRAEAPGGIEVAVKVLFRAIDTDEAKRELQSLQMLRKRLRHPYLLQNHAYWIHENHLYIVMELADGSLRDRLRECQKEGKEGIPAAELLIYFREAAEALDYLHTENVLHRDIKPDNILLLQRHAKVADFGLARLQESTGNMASATGSGTPAYMAPEMWASKVSQHTDQYCLAVSYAELRLGRRLFVGKDLMSLMHEHLQGTPDLEPLARAEQEVLLRALAKEPEQRHPSCAAFTLALEQALAPELGKPPSRPTLPVISPDQLRDRPPKRQPARPASDTADSFRTIAPDVAAAAAGMSATEIEPAARKPSVKGWQAPPVTDQAERRPGGRRWLWAAGAVLGLAAVTAVVILMSQPGETEEPTQRDKPVNRPLPPPATEVDFLPAGCAKSKGARVVIVTPEAKKKFWDRIDYVLKDGTPIPFMLVPRQRDSDPRSYYIMEDKVRNKLFAAFMRDPASKKLLQEEAKGKAWVLKNDWEKGAQAGETNLGVTNGDLPVMRVTVVEAYCFARWLKGNLPTFAQWDKAAGRFQDKPRAGPARLQPPWGQDMKNQVAVGRADQGPMRVGQAAGDVSPFLCHDMAGNGLEWTRNMHTFGTATVPVDKPKKEDRVVLRGRSYKEPTPLLFQEIEKQPETEAYKNASEEIGFRVVIEQP